MFWKRPKRRKRKESPARLRVAGRTLEVTLVRSSRRTLGVQVTREGRVVVRSPRLLPLPEIERFVGDKIDWIERHRERFRRTRKAVPDYRDGAEHLFLGKRLRLKVVAGARAKAWLEGDAIRVKAPDPMDEQRIERAVRRLIKREGEKIFAERLKALFPPFAARGHKMPRLRTRFMKRQWGSLSSKRVMTLNLNLLRAEVPLIDYVIVHELCHLEHMNHGKGFYKLLVATMPDWKPRKKQLEEVM